MIFTGRGLLLSPADADIARRDTAVTGLATLLDPDAFVAALHRSAPYADLGTAQIRYVRYKPGMNCLVAYQLEVAGAEVEVYAKAYRLDAEVKLRKSLGRSPFPEGPLGPGRILLEDYAAVVSSFPQDREVKALPRLVDAQARKHLLREVVPDRPDLWKGTLQRLAYKPERRYVARVVTRRGSQAVVKLYTGRGYHTAQRNAAAFESRGSLRIAPCLGSSDSRSVVAFQWLPGHLLSETLLNPDLDLHAVRSVGGALAELHGQDPQGLACLTREAETASLRAVATQVAFVCPSVSGTAYYLARGLGARLMEETPKNRPIHGDFYAKQVLLADGTVAILDLDRAARGDPAADLGLFIAHLQRDVLRGNLSQGQLGPLTGAFLEGYEAAARHPIPTGVELYIAVGLLHLALDPFRCREPDWPGRIAGLLERAETSLNRASAPH